MEEYAPDNSLYYYQNKKISPPVILIAYNNEYEASQSQPLPLKTQLQSSQRKRPQKFPDF